MSYKILTKIIASQLKNILPNIISKNQGGFIAGREVTNNITIVQESIHSNYERKEKGMEIKLDLANAFDRVRHSFLFRVMKSFGFFYELIKWIKECIMDFSLDKWNTYKFLQRI